MEDIEYNTLKQFHVILYAHNNGVTCITEISVHVFSCTCFLSHPPCFSLRLSISRYPLSWTDVMTCMAVYTDLVTVKPINMLN